MVDHHAAPATCSFPLPAPRESRWSVQWAGECPASSGAGNFMGLRLVVTQLTSPSKHRHVPLRLRGPVTVSCPGAHSCCLATMRRSHSPQVTPQPRPGGSSITAPCPSCFCMHHRQPHATHTVQARSNAAVAAPPTYARGFGEQNLTWHFTHKLQTTKSSGASRTSNSQQGTGKKGWFAHTSTSFSYQKPAKQTGQANSARLQKDGI